MPAEINSKLELTRHSLSHIMAAAVLKLYPKVKFAIGPAVDNGFYYDFDFGKEKLSDSDLVKIEEEMKSIIKANLSFEKSEMSVAKALARKKERTDLQRGADKRFEKTIRLRRGFGGQGRKKCQLL